MGRRPRWVDNVLERMSLEGEVTRHPRLIDVVGLAMPIAGPQVMADYWNKPDETSRVIPDGRLHTGEIVHNWIIPAAAIAGAVMIGAMPRLGKRRQKSDA